MTKDTPNTITPADDRDAAVQSATGTAQAAERGTHNSTQTGDSATHSPAASGYDASHSTGASSTGTSSTDSTGADHHGEDDHGTDSEDAVERVLRGAASRAGAVNVFATGRAAALQDHDTEGSAGDGDQADRADRAALRRVAGLSTELEDVTEVEYRQLRLENVVLIGVYPQGKQDDAENSLRELAALAETAGAAVLDGLLQRRANPDASTYLGSGKAAELAGIVKALGADTVIADTELSPSQRRALEDVVKVKVIDRTAVILDIFSQHAKSREGKAQVELAQLEYLLPRLRGWGDSMSRQAGGQVGGAGMGSRGPGETKLELDRRHIHIRMSKLRRQIKGFLPAREAKRANRQRFEVPSVAIAGYTNAGKSSLLNRITRAGVLVENALFATLDATVRKSKTEDGRVYTLTDTVGFVRNLPHQLVEAFRSTLEEVGDSDVIVHVVDGSHPDPSAQLKTVRDVITDVGARDIPEIVVFNKSDLVSEEDRLVLLGLEPHAIFASARTGEGIEEILAKIAELLPSPSVELNLLVPYDRGDVISLLHRRGRVVTLDYEEEGTRVHAFASPEVAAGLDEFAR
ncbi:GTPase HflX [Mycetocola saprophilus]|uniref:GTPase HflX n=1 Tax=Mycetocola saprophilus TaxID=76636 RepID=UPI003BF425C1